jgi:hypothetical protein
MAGRGQITKMPNKSKYLETVNGYKIYFLEQAVDGLNPYIITDSKGIVKMSRMTLQGARNWANAH